MELTLEQIKTDESVWPSGATHYKNYLFYKKTEGGWVDCTSNTLSWNSGKWFEDAAPRPTKDWLQLYSEVKTPKGTATVTEITEDDGVFTTLGNYCRSELSPTKAFVPEVGEWCEVESDSRGVWLEAMYVGVDSVGSHVFDVDKRHLWRIDSVSKLVRPIKSEREKFIEAVSKILQLHDRDITELCNKSVDMFRSQAEALYDSGKFKLVETDK
jgi:hypothetical protein